MIAVYRKKTKRGKVFILEIDEITLQLNLRRLKLLHKAIENNLKHFTQNAQFTQITQKEGKDVDKEHMAAFKTGKGWRKYYLPKEK